MDFRVDTKVLEELLEDQRRRVVTHLVSDGYEEIGEGGGRLWEIYRGARVGQRITDAVVAPDGMSVYVKIEPDVIET